MKQEKRILSFVKRNGRALSKVKQELFTELLPKYEITHNNFEYNIEKEYCLEIGYGGGEHLAYQAKQNPNINFIGCEPFIQGTAKLLKKIQEDQLENIFIYQDNAIDLINNLPDNFLSKIFILFPDPWPKNRHHKRRIINHNHLNLFAKKLKPESLLRIATDHEDYASWIIATLINNPNYKWECHTTEEWHNSPNDWCRTKYQEKSLSNGSKNYFFNFKKISAK